jgi:hypothetical protein
MTEKRGQVLLPARTCCQLNHTSHKSSHWWKGWW